MYQVFNMGHRMEIIVDKKFSSGIIDISGSFNIDAKIIGEIRAAKDQKNRLTIFSPEGQIEYE
jgi:phosphoribosylformylglycinamidine cyclo-ligase